MALHVRIDGEVVILSGLARMMNDPSYTSAVLEIDDLLDEGYRSFVLELRDVRETGAPMLGVLMTLTRHIRNTRGEIVLAHPSRSVQRLIEEMQLEEFWDVFDEVQAAARFFPRGVAIPPEQPREPRN